jgi:hypothetical protein
MDEATSSSNDRSVEYLKRSAKRLQKRWNSADSLSRIRATLPQYADASDSEIRGAKARLVECQLILAREANYDSWKALLAAVSSHSIVIEGPSFLDLAWDGDVDGAKDLLQREPALASHDGYKAHPSLREFVRQHGGHCHGSDPIADLLIPAQVRSFRDAVVADRIDDVRDMLSADPCLIDSEFIAGRGIGQAIHHWKSTSVGALLLDAGADIYAENTTPPRETPLMMQMRFGTIEGVRLLLQKGADPNHGGARPGHMLTASMPVLIKLLLDHGWNINQGAGKRTPMHHDANHGWGSRVRIWLDFGADPNVRRGDGRTALHIFAAKGTGAETIRALVKAGADINARDNEGHTALDLARLAPKKSALGVLIELTVLSKKQDDQKS